MQSSKGGGLAGAFGGGGGAGSVFGGRGAATFLSKATITLSVLFMLSAIGHTLLSKAVTGAPRSVIQEEAMRSGGTSPAAALPGVPVTDGTIQQQNPPAGEKAVEQTEKEKTEGKKEEKPPTEKK